MFVSDAGRDVPLEGMTMSLTWKLIYDGEPYTLFQRYRLGYQTYETVSLTSARGPSTSRDRPMSGQVLPRTVVFYKRKAAHPEALFDRQINRLHLSTSTPLDAGATNGQIPLQIVRTPYQPLRRSKRGSGITHLRRLLDPRKYLAAMVGRSRNPINARLLNSLGKRK